MARGGDRRARSRRRALSKYPAELDYARSGSAETNLELDGPSTPGAIIEDRSPLYAHSFTEFEV